MKKLLFLLTAMLLLSSSVNAQFDNGNGTEGDPYQIVTAEHLNNLRNYIGSGHSDKYFKLMNDIDLTTYLSEGNLGYNGGSFWLPIGNNTNRFEGKLDGNLQKITGFKINQPTSSYIGFFSYLGVNGKVENLGIEIDESASLIGQHWVAGLASYNYGTIINCYVSGTIIGTTRVGGLVGLNYSTISFCYSKGSVTGNGFGLGGIVAFNYSGGIINDSYSRSNITVTEHASYTDYGGFVGGNIQSKVINCYSTGWLKTPAEVIINGRGFCGNVTTGGNYEMTGNFWDTETSGTTSTAGGATGKTTAEMKQKSTFTEWDFNDTWSISPSTSGYISYPYLKNNTQDPLPGYEELTFAGGDGTEGDPFQISTPQQLNLVRNYLGSEHATKHFILINDIDLTDYLAVDGDGYDVWGDAGWLPIGTDANRFGGKFDGNGKKIENLFINRGTESNIGLFGVSNTGSIIKNLGVEGEIVGYVNVGGLVGTNRGNVQDCYSLVNINGYSTVGGLCGNSITGVTRSYATGNIEGYQFVGGLIGSTSSSAIITYSYATGNVKGDRYAGGFIGNLSYGQINNCYSLGNVTRVPASSQTNFGGFIGYNMQGKIYKSYSTGQVIFNDNPQDNKGFCGEVDNGGGYAMADNFWNTQTSGATSTFGGATGKTTAEMKKKSTFTNWDFDAVWNLELAANGSSSYPYLVANTQDPLPGYEEFEFPDGDGSVGTPYQITNAREFSLVRNHLDKHFLLMNNIDLAEYLAEGGEGYDAWGDAGWAPIGQYNPNIFTGSFDGGGNTISNLTINRPLESWVGLFGQFKPITPGDSIKNLTLINVNIVGNSNTGALVAEAGQSHIYNCHSSGSVTGSYMAGGLVSGLNYYGFGKAKSATNLGISNCSSSCTVTGGGEYNGGIVGYIEGENDTKKGDMDTPKTRGEKAEPYDNAILANCNFTGSVNGDGYSGGVAGYAAYTTISNCQSNITLTSTGDFNGGVIGYAYYCDITNCHSEGSVTATGYSGGVIGYLEHSNISYSTNSVDVNVGTGSDAGGIAAYSMNSTISHCTASGNVSGYDEIGGIVGNGDSNIDNCSSSGEISGVALVGGITGAIGSGIISGCTFTGEVIGEENKIGGIVGMMYSASVSNSTSSGSVSGNNHIGGIAGSTENSQIFNCQSSSQISGTTSVGGIVGYYFFTGTENAMDNCTFSGTIEGSNNIGGIAGHMGTVSKSESKLEVTDCHFTGTIEGTNSMIGGIAGRTEFANVTGCTNTGTIVSESAHLVGGIVGFFQDGTIEECESSGDITGSNFVGGIVGGFDLGPFKIEESEGNDKSLTYGISNCNSSSNINAESDDVGGIAGGISNGFIRYSSTTGSILSQNGNDIGGIAGFSVNNSLIEKCFSKSAVTGKNNVGGIVGFIIGGSTEHCYSTGSITSTANNRAGGIVGKAETGVALNYCYATGVVSSINMSGGIAGDMTNSTIKNSVALNAKVLSNGAAGRLITDNDGANTFVNNYGWDGLYVNDNKITGGELDNVSGLDAEITQLSSSDFYSNADNWDTEAWDFDVIWTQNTSISPYPILQAIDADIQKVLHAQVVTWAQELPNTLITEPFELTADGGVNRPITYTSSNPTVASIEGDELTFHTTGGVEITANIAGSEFYSPATFTRLVVIYNGQGTPENPYEISTLEQLNGVRSNLAAHYKLVADIDMGSIENWEPIGTQGTPFTGSFNGNEHTLSNLNIHGREQITGLFGCFAPESEEYNYIKDLTLANVNLSATSHIGAIAQETEGGLIHSCIVSGVIEANGGEYIGGLVGNSYNTQFTQCTSSVSINAYSIVGVGGIVGYEDSDGIISHCTFTGSISGDWNTNTVGGIVGETWGSINNCSNSGNIIGANNIGGVVGYIINVESIMNCQNSGKVNGFNEVGGIVGFIQEGGVSNCHNTGEVGSKEYRLGGIAGYAQNTTIEGCSNAGPIKGWGEIGGIVGDIRNSTITNCYNIADVSGTESSIGGIAGYATQTVVIEKSFNHGNVTGSTSIGGIVGAGALSVTVSACYSTGEVAGYYTVGGIAGDLSSTSALIGCYSTGIIKNLGNESGGIVGYLASSSISNSFAANAWLNGGTNHARIAGQLVSSTTLSNNYAWDDMYVGNSQIVGGELDNNNGLNATFDELSDDEGGFILLASWDFEEVWTFDHTKSPCPILQGIDAELQAFKHAQHIIWDDDLTGLAVTDNVPLTAVGGATGSTIYYESSDSDVASIAGTTLTVNSSGGAMISAKIDGNNFFSPATAIISLVVWDSEGTELDPHEIYNLAQLDAVRLDLNAHYILMNDIDMSPIANWEPIGENGNPFSGKFLGEGYTLSNLTINSPLNLSVGLFGEVEYAYIENVTLSNVDILGNAKVAALAGFSAGSTISNCHSSGSIQGVDERGGGIVGYAYNTNISLSSSSCQLFSFYQVVGGIAGQATDYSEIIDCWFTGSIYDVNQQAGGIAGDAYMSIISGCFDAGNISGNEYLGGIVGFCDLIELQNSYSTGSIVSTKNYTGGVSGYSRDGIIQYTYSSGEIKANIDNEGISGVLGSGSNTNVHNSVSIAANVSCLVIQDGYINRVIGENYLGDLSNNYAWADMYVNSSKVNTGTLTNENGQNASLEQLKSEAFYTTAANWDGNAWDFETVWEMDENTSPYPILKNIPANVQKVKHSQVMTNAWTQTLPQDATYGDLVPLTAPSEGPSEEIEYISSNPAVAEIVGSQLTAVGLGTATITVKYPETEFYSQSNGFSKTFRVTNKANQIIDWDQILSATYGGDDINLTATATSGLEVSYQSSNEDVAIVVGNTLTIISAGTATITASQAGNEFYNAATDVELTLTVDPRTLILSNFTAENKEYDGTTTVMGTGFDDDRLTGDELEFTYTAAFEDKNVGTDKIVNYSDIAINGGADAGNYILASTNGIAAADITARELTIGGMFTVFDKEYDGTTAATIDYNSLTLSNMVDGDDVLLVPVAAFVDAGVGEDILVVLTDGSTLDGIDSENYTLSLMGAPTTTASITEPTTSQYTLTLIIVGSGSVEVNGEEYIDIIIFDEGSEVELEAIPSAGYQFDGWSGDLESTDAMETITMNGHKVITATFSQIPEVEYSLTIQIVGNGTVEVQGSLYTEVMYFVEGSVVELEAIATTGWQFDGWTGDLVSANAMESITMNADKAVTATFSEITIPQFTLTITIIGNGSVEVDGEPYTVPVVVDEGTMLDLEAIAATGWQFDGWSGDLVSTDASESITMDADKTITATFSEVTTPQFTLTITIVGNGSVEVDGDTYTMPITVDEGTVLDLEAIATEGWQFDGWTGDLVSNNANESITMNADKAVNATFSEITIPQFTLTITIVGSGTVEVDGDVYTAPIIVDEGTVLDLEAIANEGWQFESWTGEVAEALEATTTITMNADKAITATFSEIAPTQYTLTITIVGNGSVEVNGEAYTVPITIEEGTVFDLEAIPTEGWKFDGWTGDLVSIDAIESITMDADKAITATFSLIDNVETSLLANLRVFPNPFSYFIKLENIQNVSRITITNLIGQRVLETNASGSELMTIPTDGLVNGIYLIVIEAENGERVIKKMIKE